MQMKKLAALAFAGVMMLGAAMAQTNPGTSPLSVPKGGTGKATFAANCILYGAVVSPILCATSLNNGVLTFNGSGVPTAATTLPNAVQDNITRTGTIVVGVWNGTPLLTAYIGDNQVTDGKLRQSGALSLIGRSANSTGNVADIQASAGSGCAFRESSNTVGCGTLATAAYADASVTAAKISNRTALSIFGRSANSSGVGADIAAANDAEVLRRSGTSIGFGTIATGGIADGAVTDAKISNRTALSIFGRSANSSGVGADIAAANDAEVLRRSGTSIGFGTIATGGIADGAVTDAKISNRTALSIFGRSANSSGVGADIAAANDAEVLRRSGTSIGFGTIATGGVANNAMTNAKLAQMANGTTKCRTTSGTGDPEDCSASQMRTLLSLVPGTDVQAYDADLAALAANSTAGLWANTGAGTGAARTLTAPAAGITITNPAGTAGNPTFALANDLSALEALSGTGIARRTGSDAWSVGTTVAINEGGTGQTSISQHEIWIGDGANSVAKKTMPDCTDTGGNHLNYTASTQTFTCGSSSSGGGGSGLTVDDQLQQALNSMGVARNGAVAQFYGYRFSDSFGAVTYVNTGAATNLDTGTGGLLKATIATGSQISTSGKTKLGTMTDYGGLAAGFDGTTNQAYLSSAGKATAGAAGYDNHWIGVDWGSGVTNTVGRVQMWAPNNSALHGGGGGAQFKLQGSNDGSSWTDLYTSPGAVLATSSSTLDVTSGITTTTAYRYHRINWNANGANGTQLAEVAFYSPNYTNNVTVSSTSVAVPATPAECVIYGRVKHTDTATAGTDYNFYISRDGGTTFSSAAGMTDYFTDPSDSAHVLYSGAIDVTGQPSGSNVVLKWQTSNNKVLELRDWGFRCTP